MWGQSSDSSTLTSACRPAVAALNAGSDHLLIADLGNQVDQIVSAIIDAVYTGDLAEVRLAEAAIKSSNFSIKIQPLDFCGASFQKKLKCALTNRCS
jgi:hypothetical protein